MANPHDSRVRTTVAVLAMKWTARLAIAVAVLGASCAPPKAPPAPTTLVLGTVWPGAAWDQIGQSLATAYTDRLPNVRAVAKASGNLDREIKAFEEGATDLAILDVETAYLAFNAESRDEAPSRKLRAVAALLSTAVQIVARNDADETSACTTLPIRPLLKPRDTGPADGHRGDEPALECPIKARLRAELGLGNGISPSGASNSGR